MTSAEWAEQYCHATVMQKEQVDQLVADLAAAEESQTRLAEAAAHEKARAEKAERRAGELRKYARHAEGCDYWLEDEPGSGYVCTCGLDALAAGEGET